MRKVHFLLMLLLSAVYSLGQYGELNSFKLIDESNVEFTLDDDVYFGASVTYLGDLNEDGIGDYAVGSHRDNDGGIGRGSVHILFMNDDNSVKSFYKINSLEPELAGEIDNGDEFGISIASLGDLDGDNITDIAVGAWNDSDGGYETGSIWILFLNKDGSVKDKQKISEGNGGFSADLYDKDWFGRSVANLGDFDGDGIQDIIVGASSDRDGGVWKTGAVYIILLNNDGTVKDYNKISSTKGGFTADITADLFGTFVESLGDVNGDGITDIAVVASEDDSGGADKGAIYIIYLNVDATVKSYKKISDIEGGLESQIVSGARIYSISNIGDINNDGYQELVAGVLWYDQGEEAGNTGAIFVLSLDENENVKSNKIISKSEINTLDNVGYFGGSVCVGEKQQDGSLDVIVGAYKHSVHGTNHGGVYITNLSAVGLNNVKDCELGTVNDYVLISEAKGGLNATLEDGHRFGIAATFIGDLDGDGIGDYAVGSSNDDDGGIRRGAVYILFMNDDNTVKSEYKINSLEPKLLGEIDDIDEFGIDVARLGDLNGDGVFDIAVGAWADDDGGVETGSVWILFLNTDGSVKAKLKISEGNGGFTVDLFDKDWFGNCIENIGDFDGDGVQDIAVGAPTDRDGGTWRTGAIYVILLNTDGTVKDYQKISSTEGGFKADIEATTFGSSIASLGDVDGDGITDIAVVASEDNSGGIKKGAVYILYLNADATVKSYKKISDIEGGLDGEITDGARIIDVSNVGDLNNDGYQELLVGVIWYDAGTGKKGGAFICSLDENENIKSFKTISSTEIGELTPENYFGISVDGGTRHDDGSLDIIVGDHLYKLNGEEKGAVYVINICVEKPIIKDCAFSISGNITSGGEFLEHGKVYLYTSNNGFVSKVSSTSIVSGTYSFDELCIDNYFIKVVPPNSSNYHATYYGGVKNWKDATGVHVNNDFNGLDIDLVSKNKLCNSKITGMVYQGNKLVESGTLYLYDASKLVMSDAVIDFINIQTGGNYVFEDLCDGLYIILVLPEDNQDNKLFFGNYNQYEQAVPIPVAQDEEISNANIDIKYATSIEDANDLLSSIIYYPNPVTDILNIKLSENKISNGLNVIIQDMSGKQLYSSEVSGLNLDGEIQVDMSGFSRGTYICNIVLLGSNEPLQFKIIKM